MFGCFPSCGCFSRNQRGSSIPNNQEGSSPQNQPPSLQEVIQVAYDNNQGMSDDPVELFDIVFKEIHKNQGKTFVSDNWSNEYKVDLMTSCSKRIPTESVV